MKHYGVDVLKCIWEFDESLPSQKQLLLNYDKVVIKRDEARRLAEWLRCELRRVIEAVKNGDRITVAEFEFPWEVKK